MGATWLICVKDLRLRLRDRSLLILAFVAPLALSFVFNIVFGGLDDGERITFDFGVVDLDGGDVAAGFSSMMDDIESSGLITVTTFPDADAGRGAVDDGAVDAVIVLPDGLSAAIAAGGERELQVIGDVDSPTATSVAGSIARGYVTSVDTGTLAGIVAASTGVVPMDQIGVVAEEVAADPLASLTTLETESTQLDLTATLTAGMSVFFVFFVAGLAVTGILQERQDGTLPRLLISPASRSSILLGKSLSAVLTGIVALFALLVASTVIMGAEWGDPLATALLAVAAVLAATGIMSLVGGLARTAEQAGSLQAVIAVSMAMLGGSFGMVAPSSDSLWGRLSLLTPNAWFLDGLGRAQLGLGEAVTPLLALLAMAVVTGGIAAALAGRVLTR
ncbi:MAG: ABC transporter permease [Acidimicrobiales bacterium]